MRCDVIADGIVEALTVMGVEVPVVVRLEGNSADKGIKILDECALNIIPAANLRKLQVWQLRPPRESANEYSFR